MQWNQNGIIFNAGPMTIFGQGTPAVFFAANPNMIPQAGDGYVDGVALMMYGPYTTTWPAGTTLQGPKGDPGPGGGPASVGFVQLTTPFTAGASWTTVFSKTMPGVASGNGMKIEMSGTLGNTVGGQASYVRLLRDTTPIAQPTGYGSRFPATAGIGIYANFNFAPVSINLIDFPGDTVSHTYSLQLCSQAVAGVACLGQRGDDTDSPNYGRFITTMNLWEVTPV